MLARPPWAAFVSGSADRFQSGGAFRPFTFELGISEHVDNKKIE
jgi:hypothetical protein